jgi:hypothetical protein
MRRLLPGGPLGTSAPPAVANCLCAQTIICRNQRAASTPVPASRCTCARLLQSACCAASSGAARGCCVGAAGADYQFHAAYAVSCAPALSGNTSAKQRRQTRDAVRVSVVKAQRACRRCKRARACKMAAQLHWTPHLNRRMAASLRTMRVVRGDGAECHSRVVHVRREQSRRCAAAAAGPATCRSSASVRRSRRVIVEALVRESREVGVPEISAGQRACPAACEHGMRRLRRLARFAVPGVEGRVVAGLGTAGACALPDPADGFGIAAAYRVRCKNGFSALEHSKHSVRQAQPLCNGSGGREPLCRATCTCDTVRTRRTVLVHLAMCASCGISHASSQAYTAMPACGSPTADPQAGGSEAGWPAVCGGLQRPRALLRMLCAWSVLAVPASTGVECVGCESAACPARAGLLWNAPLPVTFWGARRFLRW